MTLHLREQGSSGTCERSDWFFVRDAEKPFRVTPAAARMFTRERIEGCLGELQERARQSGGLFYIQSFRGEGYDDDLWLIEDDGEGAITACLRSAY
jgi:hypothetical protein